MSKLRKQCHNNKCFRDQSRKFNKRLVTCTALSEHGPGCAKLRGRQRREVGLWPELVTQQILNPGWADTTAFISILVGVENGSVAADPLMAGGPRNAVAVKACQQHRVTELLLTNTDLTGRLTDSLSIGSPRNPLSTLLLLGDNAASSTVLCKPVLSDKFVCSELLLTTTDLTGQLTDSLSIGYPRNRLSTSLLLGDYAVSTTVLFQPVLSNKLGCSELLLTTTDLTGQLTDSLSIGPPRNPLSTSLLLGDYAESTTVLFQPVLINKLVCSELLLTITDLTGQLTDSLSIGPPRNPLSTSLLFGDYDVSTTVLFQPVLSDKLVCSELLLTITDLTGQLTDSLSIGPPRNPLSTSLLLGDNAASSTVLCKPVLSDKLVCSELLLTITDLTGQLTDSLSIGYPRNRLSTSLLLGDYAVSTTVLFQPVLSNKLVCSELLLTTTDLTGQLTDSLSIGPPRNPLSTSLLLGDNAASSTVLCKPVLINKLVCSELLLTITDLTGQLTDSLSIGPPRNPLSTSLLLGDNAASSTVLCKPVLSDKLVCSELLLTITDLTGQLTDSLSIGPPRNPLSTSLLFGDYDVSTTVLFQPVLSNKLVCSELLLTTTDLTGQLTDSLSIGPPRNPLSTSLLLGDNAASSTVLCKPVLINKLVCSELLLTITDLTGQLTDSLSIGPPRNPLSTSLLLGDNAASFTVLCKPVLSDKLVCSELLLTITDLTGQLTDSLSIGPPRNPLSTSLLFGDYDVSTTVLFQPVLSNKYVYSELFLTTTDLTALLTIVEYRPPRKPLSTIFPQDKRCTHYSTIYRKDFNSCEVFANI
ncbi:hypothetical protein J6590_063795 [Homalodisca vitripennis]|nr:hypothetical protein J6590_063795 [Homalodisca vitripennis]